MESTDLTLQIRHWLSPYDMQQDWSSSDHPIPRMVGKMGRWIEESRRSEYCNGRKKLSRILAEEVLRGFQAAAAGVMGSAVVSIDGFAIGSLLPGSMEEPRLSAMQIGRLAGVAPKLDFQKDRSILRYQGCPL